MTVENQWSRRPLGDVCEFKYGKSLPESLRSGGGVPVYGSNGVVGGHDVPLTASETIVIGRKGSHGEVNFSDIPCWPIDTTYYVDSTATTANLHWLKYRLAGAGLNQMNRAAAVPGLNREDAYRVEILLPPPEEQRRIATILDQADALRAQRRAALTQLDSLVQSIFLDMFGDPLANPMGWNTHALTDAVNEIQIGPFGSLLHQEDYVPGGIPLVNPMHIKDGKIIHGREQAISKHKYQQLALYQLRAGDVIMGRRGEMGRCAIVSDEDGPLMCGTGSLFIRPDTTKANVHYLFAVLSSSRLKTWLEEFSLGATMPNLNKGIVAGLKLAFPPLSLQKTFATRIQAVETLKANHRAALVELDALFASLQHRAFNGDLTTAKSIQAAVSGNLEGLRCPC